jgi:hypothetical protein
MKKQTIPTLDQQARNAHAEILAAIQRYGLVSWLAGHRAGITTAKATKPKKSKRAKGKR